MGSWKSRIFATDLETKLNPLNTKIMATYKITLEFETVLSVNGKRVKSEVTRNTQTVTDVSSFADVATSWEKTQVLSYS